MFTDVAPHPTPTLTRRTTAVIDRLAGAGGIVFVALLVVQNAIRASEPSLAAQPATVATYFAGHRTAVLVPLALFPLGMIALLSYAAGIRRHVRDEQSRWWANLGSSAVVVLAGLFAVVNMVEIVIAADSRLGSAPEVLRALWTLHSAAFGLDLSAIAIALVGLSRSAYRTGLAPRWLASVALPGAGCLLVASASTVSMAQGGHWLYLGLAGFVVWAVLLVVTGVRLIGAHEDDCPS